MSDCEFKTPLTKLLKHFSMEEINGFSREHANFIDEAFIRASSSYNNALETCPDDMPIEKWQILCNLKDFKKIFENK